MLENRLSTTSPAGHGPAIHPPAEVCAVWLGPAAGIAAPVPLRAAEVPAEVLGRAARTERMAAGLPAGAAPNAPAKAQVMSAKTDRPMRSAMNRRRQ